MILSNKEIVKIHRISGNGVSVVLKRKHKETYDFISNKYTAGCKFVEKLYQHILQDFGKCVVCESQCVFLSFKEGYRKHCSVACASRDTNIKEDKRRTMIKRYGVDNIFKSEEFKTKAKKTKKEKYGDENFNNRIKASETKLNLYGNANFNNHNKSEETNLQKYGVKCYLETDECKKRTNEINQEKYGVDWITQSEHFKEKAKDTTLEKYGVDNFAKSPLFLEKYKETCMMNHGTEYASQSNTFKDKAKITYFKRLLSADRFNGKIKLLFDLSEYDGAKKSYSFECLKCNQPFNSKLGGSMIPRCPSCFSPRNTSIGEKEATEYVRKLIPTTTIIENSKKIISPLELDIYLPEYKLAIEYNGITWHSEGFGGKTKHYHISKTKKCEELGIRLIHIFDTEWVDSTDIVKSILKNALIGSSNKIHARKCALIEVPKAKSDLFLFDNHLQGIDNSHIRIAATHNNEIVALMTFSKPRYNKSYEWEIVRYAIKQDCQITGIAARLLNYFKEKYHPKSIISYADRRYFTGKIYEKLGFQLIGETPPNYFYFGKGYDLTSRLQFQKHKLKSLLEIFDPALTEWQNMQLNGFDRIWDCGSLKYSMVF